MSNFGPINYGQGTPGGGAIQSLAESELGLDNAGRMAGESFIGGLDANGNPLTNTIAQSLANQGGSFQNVGAPSVYNQGIADWRNNGQVDQGQQLAALANLQAQAQGTGPNYAQQTTNQGVQAAQANQSALAAGAGAGARGALAQRAAQAQSAQVGTQGRNQANILQAQGQTAAQNAYAQGLGQYQKGIANQQQLEQQAIEQQAAVNQQQQNLADWAQQQYTGQAQQVEATQLSNDTNRYITGANAINSQNIASANAQAQQQASEVSGFENAAGMFFGFGSDIRNKDEIKPQGKAMNGRPFQSQMMGGHPLSEGTKAQPMTMPMTGQAAGQRFNQPGGMAPMGARPPLGQVMGGGPSPQYMGALRGAMGGGGAPPMGGAQPFSRKNNIVMQPGAPAMAYHGGNRQVALGAGGGLQMGGAMGQAMAAPPQQAPNPMMAGYGGGMGALMSDERAKMVSRDLMSSPPSRGAGLSDGRALLAGPADANRDYRPHDAFFGLRQEYQPPPSITSDERAKVGDMGDVTEADHFLAHLHPYTYRYKDPSNEPTNEPTGGHYLGVMAQDVEQTPGVGRQIVKDTPRGKMLEGGALMSAMAGGLGRLHERVSALEGMRR